MSERQTLQSITFFLGEITKRRFYTGAIKLIKTSSESLGRKFYTIQDFKLVKTCFFDQIRKIFWGETMSRLPDIKALFTFGSIVLKLPIHHALMKGT